MLSSAGAEASPAAVPSSSGCVAEPTGGRRPLGQFFLGAGLYVAAQLGAVLVVLPLLLASGQGTDGMLNLLLTEPVVSTAFFLGYAVLSLAGFALISRRLAPRTFQVTFRCRGVVRELRVGAAIGAALMTLGVGLLAVLGVYQGRDARLDVGLVMGIAMGIGAACGEEVFFRGFMFRLLNARFGSAVALLVTGIVFGMSHAANPGAGVFGGVAITLSAGLLLPGAYMVIGRLWLAIGIHFAWNAVQSGIFGIVVSGATSTRGIFAGTLTGPIWLSGGSLGIEGSVPLIVMSLLAGAALLGLAVRQGKWRSFRDARREVTEAKQSVLADG